MHPNPRLVKFLRVKGHAVDASRMYGADWVRGALLVGWALVVGTFMAVGGPNGFKSPVYKALIETFPCPEVIGGTLVFAGLLGAFGVWGDWRRLSKASAILCATWHGLFFSYTFPANLGAFGNTNLISLFALLVCLMYLVQLIEIWPKPTDKATYR